MILRLSVLVALASLSLSSTGCWRHRGEPRHVDVVEVHHEEPRVVEKRVDVHEDRR